LVTVQAALAVDAAPDPTSEISISAHQSPARARRFDPCSAMMAFFLPDPA
jgi:hypothetical protein